MSTIQTIQFCAGDMLGEDRWINKSKVDLGVQMYVSANTGMTVEPRHRLINRGVLFENDGMLVIYCLLFVGELFHARSETSTGPGDA